MEGCETTFSDSEFRILDFGLEDQGFLSREFFQGSDLSVEGV